MSEIDTDRREIELNPIYYQPENWQQALKSGCYCHSQLMPAYICPVCGLSFCKNCAQFAAHTRACGCINCGALCRDYQEVKEQILYLQQQSAPFGFSDLIIALRYPLDMKVFPLVLFSIFIATSFFAFTFFMGVVILFYWCTHTIKDVTTGNQRGASNIDFASFLTELFSPLLTSCATLFISFAPILLIYTINNYFIRLFMPLAVIWAIGYYPIALMVAGTTESFINVINPLVGFNTLRQMKNTLPWLVAYYLLLISPTLIFILFMPSELGLFGFLLFFGAIMGAPFFYSQMVLSCLIGRALFKSARNLDLPTNIKN